MYVLIKYCKLNHEATAAAVYYLDAAVMCSSSKLASEYIEVATARDRFLCVPPSVIAYAALLSAIEVDSNYRQQQQQQQYDFDFSTFLHNMKHIAEMGDIFSDFDTESIIEKNGTTTSNARMKSVARSVRRTKILLDRIVKGVTLPPEDEDDFFNKTELAMRSNFSYNHNIENQERNIFTDCKTMVKSSSPNSPTSTVSSVHTTSRT